MDFLEYCEINHGKNGFIDPWHTFYQTRDWYDMPPYIRENDELYIDVFTRSWSRKKPNRFYIYPKDIEYMYDCTPEVARSLLSDVRESLDLPISGPVTYYDLQKYTGLDMQTIHDFIMES